MIIVLATIFNGYFFILLSQFSGSVRHSIEGIIGYCILPTDESFLLNLFVVLFAQISNFMSKFLFIYSLRPFTKKITICLFLVCLLD